jgi:transposase
MPTKSRSRGSRCFEVHKPRGLFRDRVQAVGPEHFGIVAIDCAKAQSKLLFCDFYGNLFLPPTEFSHTKASLAATLQHIRQAIQQHQVNDVLVAIERTSTYHRPVQDAFRQAGYETRLVHPYASRQFRQAADPHNKTDDTDLSGIFKAAVNGFGLCEPDWTDAYQQLQLLSRHRRDLVRKNAKLRCQIRECLHALMPGYAECFADPFQSPVALPLARRTGSAQAILQAGLAGLQQHLGEAQVKARLTTLSKILAWASDAPAASPQGTILRSVLETLDADRLDKNRHIARLEQQAATLVAGMPYVLLLAIPGINVVSIADLAGELGPMANYANANHITGRAGVMPTRYQSGHVDRADGRLRASGHRRLRTALLQIADNLVNNNHYFSVQSLAWKAAGKDPRWIRVKIAKKFTRLAYAIVAGRTLFPHPCCQPRHYILDKLLAFHREHATPMDQVLRDLDAATQQLPRSTYAQEAQPLYQRLEQINQRRSNRPQLLGDILPIVLARLGIDALQSKTREAQDPS